MLTFISYHMSTSQEQSEEYQAIASALFSIPFFLFSATAGQLADKYDKAFLTRIIKGCEVLLISIGALAFIYSNVWLLMTVLLGMGLHSTFFGPIKYAILPNLLAEDELLDATGLIEASTFVAILLGTILGTLSVGGVNTHVLYAIIILGLAASVGFISSWFILPASSVASELKINWNIWLATVQMMKIVADDKRIMLCIFAISWFWLVAAVLLTKLPDYTNYILHGMPAVFAVFLTLFSVGIALGSLTVSKVLSGKVTLKYTPYALLLVSMFIGDVYFASPKLITPGSPLLTVFVFFHQLNHWRIAFDLLLLSFSCGLFVVPLYTYLQLITGNETRARIIAANNIINALFIILGTVLVVILLSFKLSIPLVFFIVAIINLGAVALLMWMIKRYTSN